MGSKVKVPTGTSRVPSGLVSLAPPGHEADIPVWVMAQTSLLWGGVGEEEVRTWPLVLPHRAGAVPLSFHVLKELSFSPES